MEYYKKPFFIVKNILQKSAQTGEYFSEVVTTDVLEDVCRRITGETDFEYCFVDKAYEDEFLPATYNKGRLAILHFKDMVNYISFSEKDIVGRNSSIQSVPTAYNMFYSNPYPKKNLYYYFLNKTGNIETAYHQFMYRLMSTVGFIFLNAREALSKPIQRFVSIDDIISNRRVNASRNASNNSTFINKCGTLQIEVYGKTYGANKYETSLICYALSTLCGEEDRITLFEMIEKGITELPRPSLNVIEKMGAIDVVAVDESLERKILFGQDKNLRSPRYLYNLASKLGEKSCVLCGCDIPELVQGAHVWPVADIKKDGGLTQEQKFKAATDGDNGLWLCENHHKMFDERMITFDEHGELLFSEDILDFHREFIDESTPYKELPEYILTEGFLKYLYERNKAC